MTDEADEKRQFDLSNLQDGAREHPYVAFGVLMVPVTFAVTGDPMMALFTGGIVAFGPAIGEGFNELGDDEDEDTGENNE